MSKRLLLFITLVLLIQIIIVVSQTKKTTKLTTVSKAAEIQCPTVSGNESYQNSILFVGPNIAANNNPDNYKQIREQFNCQNGNNSTAQNSYIPVTVMYDLFFLKGNVAGIQENLEALKKYGLYPIIRISSYTNGNNWIKLYPPTDAVIMGENLGKAMSNVKGFPQAPIVTYLNEVNLHAEWEGKANPEEFAESFSAFAQGIQKGGNYQLFFPALSYGANDQNGIDPQTFISRFFNSKKFTGKFDGIALNIYGQSYSDIETQYNEQKNPFDASLKTVIAELGPVRRGAADTTCDTEWQNTMSPIVSGIITNKLTLATMACFGNQTIPAIVSNYSNDNTQAKLITLGNTSGQVPNTETSNTTNTNQQNKNATTNINFSPQNPALNTKFQVDVSSTTTHTYVYMKIFKQNDDKNAVFRPPTNSDVIPQVTKGNPNHWIYEVPNGLPEGNYQVKFYNSCRDASGDNCSEVKNAARTLFIGSGKTNEIQQKTTNTQTTFQNQTANNNTKTQPVVANVGNDTIDVFWETNQLTIKGNLLKQLKLDTTVSCNTITDKPEQCLNNKIPSDIKYGEDNVILPFTGDRPQGICAYTKTNTAANVRSDYMCLIIPK